MAQTVGALQPFSVYTQIHEEGVKKRSTFDRVKNILTGRVFTNWREQLLGGVTVLYVIKAALSFFSAAFFPALFQFSMAAFMAILRKEIADFTNLHKATKDYRSQNMKHALNNLELRENVQQFKHEIRSLRREAERFEASNEQYAYNNEMHRHLLGNLEKTTDDLASELRDAMASGQAVSQRILQGFLSGVERIQDQKKLLRGVQRELRADHHEHLGQLEKVLGQVQSASDRQIRAVTQANAELEKSRRSLEKIRRDLAQFEGQAEALKGEIENLKEVRAGLQTEIRHLTQARQGIDSAVTRLGVAAERNVQSANMVAGFFKSLFFHTTPDGNSEVSLDKSLGVVLLIACVAGAAAKYAFPSSDAPNISGLRTLVSNGLGK